MALRLSVNLNKVALLRNSRGASNPSPWVAGQACLDAGADGLTLHWRADERHTRRADVVEFRALCRQRGAELNLEGDDRPELLELAIELGVDQFTLVPVRPGEITSDHGWDLPAQHSLVAPILAQAAAAGIRTSVFVDVQDDEAAATRLMAAVAAAGADRVELYTEPVAAAFATPRQAAELARVALTARAAVRAGLGVNAGHDLNLANLPVLAREVPELAEVSIGHALLADALYLGLAETIRRYLAACRGEDVAVPVTQ